MANRHSHKKLRADIRSRMAATGESYQKARHRILQGEATPRGREGADLVAAVYFGMPITLATWEWFGQPLVMLVPGFSPVQGSSEREKRRAQYIEHARSGRTLTWRPLAWMTRPRGVQ